MGRNVKVGVVLSGGGAYGAFQAGVLDALIEAGIKPTHFTGTSIGALNAVLASEHSVQHLRKFWLDMPKTVENELLLAKPQWLSMLASFSTIPTRAAEEVLDTGRAAGAGFGAGAGWIVGGPFGAFVGALLGGAVGKLASASSAQETGKNVLNELLREKEDEGPIVSKACMNVIKRSIMRPKMKSQVYVTVANHGDISADDLIKMKETRSVEIGSRGHLELIDRDNRVEVTVASMAIPFLIGRNNDHNPTKYFDGGLIDNIPVHGLLSEQKSGEIDCMVVVDVSGNETHLRETRAEELRHGPVVYINLQRQQGWERLLDFEKSKSLYRKGYSAGREALEHILLFEPQEIIDDWNATESLLPKDFIIKRAA